MTATENHPVMPSTNAVGVKRMLVEQFWLAVWLVVSWLVVSVPIALSTDVSALRGTTVAGLICFLPGCVAVVLQPFWDAQGIGGLGALAGGVFRLVFVLGALVAARFGWFQDSFLTFAIEVVVFYLVMLAVETYLVVKRMGRGALQR